MNRSFVAKLGAAVGPLLVAGLASAGSPLIQTSVAPAPVPVANPTSIFSEASTSNFFAVVSSSESIIPVSDRGQIGATISNAPVTPFRCAQANDDEIYCTGTRPSGNTTISTISRNRDGIVTFYDTPDPDAFTGFSADVDIVVSDQNGAIVTVDSSTQSLTVLSMSTWTFSQVPFPDGVSAVGGITRNFAGEILVPFLGTNQVAAFDGVELTPFTVPAAPGQSSATVEAAAPCGSDVCVIDSAGTGLTRCDSEFLTCTFVPAPAESSCFHAVRIGCGGRGAICVATDETCQGLHEFDFAPGQTPTAVTVSNPLGGTPEEFRITENNGVPTGLMRASGVVPSASSLYLFSLPAPSGPDVVANLLETDSVLAGERSFQLKVKNIGTKPANNVKVTVDLGGLDFVSFKNVDSVYFGSKRAGNILTLSGIAPLPEGVALAGIVKFSIPPGATTDFTVNAYVICNNDTDPLNNTAQPLDVPPVTSILFGTVPVTLGDVTGR